MRQLRRSGTSTSKVAKKLPGPAAHPELSRDTPSGTCINLIAASYYIYVGYCAGVSVQALTITYHLSQCYITLSVSQQSYIMWRTITSQVKQVILAFFVFQSKL